MHMSRRQILISTSFGVILLLIVSFIYMLRFPSQSKSLSQSQITPFIVPTTALSETNTPLRIIKPPEVKFAHWQFPANTVVSTNAVPVYYLKSNYDDASIQNFGQKLGVTSAIQEKNESVMMGDSNAFLLFNKGTGAFTYFTRTGLKLASDKNTEESIIAVLKDLGIYDTSLRLTATYRKKNQSTVRYFEFHRNWDRLRLPIYSKPGLLNMPENLSFSTFSFTPQRGVAAVDTSIYETSDQSDGLARQRDFNTVTVAVSEKDNQIMYLSSSLRPLNSEKLSLTNMLSLEEAKSALLSGQNTEVMTIPAGEGAVKWESVYPQNIADADEATISEVTIAYLEEAPTQVQVELKPWYIFKGLATLKSGYRVRFIATIPAAKQTQTFLQKVLNFLASPVAAQSYENQYGSQKQGTFQLSAPSPTPSPTPTIPVVIPPTTPPTGPSSCTPALEKIQPLQDWRGIQVGYYPGEPPLTPLSQPAGYYLADSQGFITEEQVTRWVDEAMSDYGPPGQGGVRDIIDIMREVYTIPNCPIRLTGPSPSLFIYGLANTQYSITPQFNLTYADPGTSSANTWTVKHSTVNDLTRDFIYYEYQPVTFSKPVHGWRIDKKNLPVLVENIAQSLHVTTEEKDRLEFELYHAASDVRGEKIYIGLLDSQSVRQKLPLAISPPIDTVYRYHFYLSSTAPSAFTDPTLEIIHREKEMIVEFGALAEE